MSAKFAAAVVACTVLTCAIGCAPEATDAAKDVEVDLLVDPSPPVVGDADVTVTLASASGQPLAGAEVRLEGNMNHAGMKPSFADLSEVEPGRYTGTLEFTMGGDWFIFVTATTKDGRVVEHSIDVPGVKVP